MRYMLAAFLWTCALRGGTARYVNNSSEVSNRGDLLIENYLMNTSVKIKIGKKSFIATLEDNASASAFEAMLPLTMEMTELNGNEKYFGLPKGLPTNASNPGTIHAGDILLWGASTVVIFYQTFSTSHSYTKLGRIDDPKGLAAALGSGDVTVKIDQH